ncbi:hypothetical protein HAX54_007072, partial [Datura stramonium]|nr:hypothetical protein [Datura stramonium]
IYGEQMAKHFDLIDARKLFQQLDVQNLHHLALIPRTELHINDKGKLSNSWSDFFIVLHSNFVTLRHDDDMIVEPYSPH